MITLSKIKSIIREQNFAASGFIRGLGAVTGDPGGPDPIDNMIAQNQADAQTNTDNHQQLYQQWHAGDFHIFDWPNVPHATANASQHSRITLQITGLRTAETNKIIGNNPFLYQNL